LHIRKSEKKDLPEITEIFNQAVKRTTATFTDELRSEEDMWERMQRHSEDFPMLVAENKGAVAGWASLNPFIHRSASVSVYIREEYRYQGLGKNLLTTLLKISREKEHRTLVAWIEGSNQESIKLHKNQGFKFKGSLEKVGYKFERFLDLHIYQYMVNEE